MLCGFERGVLADTLTAAKHQRVVDLFLRTLNPVAELVHDMLVVVAENLMNVIEPPLGFGGVT